MLDVVFYFNFRSPYCYLASNTVWDVLDAEDVNLIWKPLGGWAGRSDPERAKIKIPLVRQDIKRWAQKLGIPMVPPPITTDPTRAGAVSVLAENEGKLKDYIIAVMNAEWAEGRDIGDLEVLCDVCAGLGMEASAVIDAARNPDNLAILDRNAEDAKNTGVFGVPTFVIGEDMFWGNDRIEFVRDHLQEQRIKQA